MKTYIQDFNTLRLMIMYSQFADVDIVRFAFNVLQDKDYEKSIYIAKAIKYYDETINDSAEITEALFPIRCMKFIKGYYGIKTKKDIAKMLDLGLESETFKNAEKRMLKDETPRASLLGFKRTDPEATKMHDRLFQMDVRPRIMLISAAIKKYVMDGMDSAALMACSYKMVHDVMLEYANSDNKKAIIQDFYNLLQQSNSISDTM